GQLRLLLLGETAQGLIDAVPLGAAEPVDDRTALVRERDERPPGIVGVGLPPQQPELDALGEQTRRPRLIDADRLPEGADPQCRAGLHEGGQQAQQSASATVPAPPQSGMGPAAGPEPLPTPRTAEAMFAAPSPPRATVLSRAHPL